MELTPKGNQLQLYIQLFPNAHEKVSLKFFYSFLTYVVNGTNKQTHTIKQGQKLVISPLAVSD